MSESKNVNLFKIISLVIILGSFIFGFIAYPNLPDQVPAHWNTAGEVDRYTDAFKGAFLPPLIMIGVFVLMLVVPKIDPKKKNYEKMSKTYWSFLFILILFFAVLHVGTLLAALGYFKSIPRLTIIAVGCVFIVLGNFMGKIKHNYTFGIRTPWTLASEEIWYKTHRKIAPYWMIGGFLILISSFFPSSWTFALVITVLISLSIASFGYSYFLFRKNSR